MGQEEWQTFCPTCQRIVLGRRDTPNHILHFLITVFSCGLWAIVWGFLWWSADREPFRCPTCGSAGVNK